MWFFRGSREVRSLVDHRKSCRVTPPPHAPVKIQIMGLHSLDFTNAKDISITGIGVHVPHGFEACNLESDVELVITLPGKRSFSAVGALRHRSKGDEQSSFGIEFTQISEASCLLIEMYIDDFKQGQES